MDDMEEGELPDSPSGQDTEDIPLNGDAIDAPYTPLLRPESVKSITNIVTRPRSATNSSTVANMGDISDFDDVRTCDNPTPSGSSSPKTSYQNAENDDDDDIETPADRILRGLPGSSSDEGSDSDNETGGRPVRKMRRSYDLTLDKGNSSNSGGEAFRAMASQFQQDRASQFAITPQQQRIKKTKANNVWGAVLTEETLTSDLTGIGVGKRSLKELGSDRGAETYDYMMAAEVAAGERAEANIERVKREEEIRRSSLDQDLEQYWQNRGAEPGDKTAESPSTLKGDAMDSSCDDSRRIDAIRAGKKRSITERLGNRRTDQMDSGHLDLDDGQNQIDNMSIPQPGVSRNIPDISPSVLEMLQESSMKNEPSPDAVKMDNDDPDDDGEVDDDDDEVSDDLKSTILGEELAAKLSEPKAELMIGVVDLVGAEVALELFAKTQAVEKDGGMMIKNGARRRTPGGVYLHLLRGLKDPRVNVKEIKSFFNNNSCNHRPPPRPHHHYGRHNNYDNRSNYGMGDKQRKDFKAVDNFQAELDAFQKLSKSKAKKKSRSRGPKKMDEEEEDLKPLPDILSLITKQSPGDDDFSQIATSSSSAAATSGSGCDDLGLPDVPPNSVEPVERTISVYEDDFLSAETEDIDLF